MLDAEQQTVEDLYRIRPNGNQQYPEGFIRNLSSMEHGSRVPPPTMHLVVCPNPQCQSLVRYGVQVLLVCQFEVGLHLKLAALIDFLRKSGDVGHGYIYLVIVSLGYIYLAIDRI